MWLMFGSVQILGQSILYSSDSLTQVNFHEVKVIVQTYWSVMVRIGILNEIIAQNAFGDSSSLTQSFSDPQYLKQLTHLTFTCSKSAMEAPEDCVKWVQS